MDATLKGEKLKCASFVDGWGGQNFLCIYIGANPRINLFSFSIALATNINPREIKFSEAKDIVDRWMQKKKPYRL